MNTFHHKSCWWWLQVSALLLSCLMASSACAKIIPQYFQAQASDAVVLRLEESKTVKSPDAADKRSMVIMSCRVEGVLWSDSGLLTNDTLQLVIPVDPKQIAGAKEWNDNQRTPGPQLLYIEPPDLPDAKTAPLFRAFLSSVATETAVSKVADWGDWAVSAINSYNPRNGFFLAGAAQYSFLDYFATGLEFPGLLQSLDDLANSGRAADAAILLSPVEAQAFSATLDESQAVELASGTILEWMGPAGDEKGADHWAYDPDSSTLYRLPCNSMIAKRSEWLVRHCDLTDAKVREKAMAFAIGEKKTNPLVRAFAAEQRLKKYHTRLERIANSE